MVITGACAMSASAYVTATALRYVIVSITYGAALAAGATLVIDVDAKTAKVAHADVRKDITGSFPMIYPGANSIEYSDSESSRTVAMNVIHEERYA